MSKLKLSSRLFLILGLGLLIYFMFFYTQTATGKILLIQEEGVLAQDKIVKFRTSEGELKTLLLSEDSLGLDWFDDKPNKIISILSKSERLVSVNKFIEDATLGEQNVPNEGFPVKVTYEPHFIKKILFFKRNDGEIKEIVYTSSAPVKNNVLNLKEISRSQKKPYSINYSFKLNLIVPDLWFVVDGEKGEVNCYKRDGERFVENVSYSYGKPETKFIEDFTKPYMSLVSFNQQTTGDFTVKFPDLETMVKNSYEIETKLNQAATKIINEQKGKS